MEKLDATNDNVSHPSGLKSNSRVSRAGNSKRSRGEINLSFFDCCYSLSFDDLPFEV